MSPAEARENQLWEAVTVTRDEEHAAIVFTVALEVFSTTTCFRMCPARPSGR